MKLITVGMLAIMSLAACGPSDAPVATPIAETEAARPTETSTPTQTPTASPTKTATPTLMPTSTATPEPTTPLGVTYEGAKIFFDDLSGTSLTFEYVYDLSSTQVYESVWVDAGTHVYLMKKGDYIFGIMISILDRPVYDTDTAILFMVDTLTSYVGESAAEFVMENWPDAGDSESKTFQVEEGALQVGIRQDKEDVYVITIFDLVGMED